MTVSIVLEWETMLEQSRERGEACLASLRSQVEQFPGAQTIVCFDAADVDEASVRDVVGGRWPGPLVVAGTSASLDYYGKKNHGFTLALGDIVVFVDSDLILEPDWLRNLIEPFADFRRSVVVGRTHLETRTLYERAVALFWIFDPRLSGEGIRPTSRLVSNNVAFRRALFARFPFPDRPTFRGQCSELASTLRGLGIELYEQPSARACHPAPDGARRFLARAYAAGADHAFYDDLEGSASLRRGVANLRTDLCHVRERVRTRASMLEADRPSRVAAHLLGLAYYLTKAAGYGAANRAARSRRNGQSGG